MSSENVEPTLAPLSEDPTEVISVPEFFHLVDMNHLTVMIADMLCRLTAHNDQIPLTTANLTRFHSRAPPQISVYEYLRRIVKYTSLERACLLVVLIYIDRVCEKARAFTISSLTVHRFIIAAVTLAAKAVCDSYCTNSHYAKVGGLSTQELNTLEMEFLELIEWRVAVEGGVLQRYYVNLVRQHSRFEINLRPETHSIHAQQHHQQQLFNQQVLRQRQLSRSTTPTPSSQSSQSSQSNFNPHNSNSHCIPAARQRELDAIVDGSPLLLHSVAEDASTPIEYVDDAVSMETNYTEGLRDQWIPTGE